MPLQFIEERLDMLNAGLGFSDEFEMEACNYSDKTSSRLKQQYKEWTYTMKKEGSAFFKSVKSRVSLCECTYMSDLLNNDVCKLINNVVLLHMN